MQGYLLSGGEDQMVLIWSFDTSRSEEAGRTGSGGGAGSSKEVIRPKPHELIFQHVGHRQGKVVDCQWCPDDTWTIASVSDNENSGTLQVRRGGGAQRSGIWVGEEGLMALECVRHPAALGCVRDPAALLLQK